MKSFATTPSLREWYLSFFSEKQREKFHHFIELLKEFNQKINLVSRKDIDNVEAHHLLPSLALLQITELKGVARCLDVGSGGGFPGIPLAIALSNVHFTLIEARRKKVFCLQHFIKELQLSNVEVIWGRVEEMRFKSAFDLIFGRAVTNLITFYQWTHSHLSRRSFPDSVIPYSGILYYKGLDVDEFKLFSPSPRYFLLSDYFSDPYLTDKTIVYLSYQTRLC